MGLDRQQQRRETRGMLLGATGVVIFSLTLPFTRMAVAELHPVFVACGRAVVAAVAAALFLIWIRAPWPSRSECRSLAWVALGVVFGFPLFISFAMAHVPASHGAIVTGVLPLATALWAVIRFGERPSAGFWFWGLAGSAIVVCFALSQGGGKFQSADLALFGAVAAAAVGYGEGATMARNMGGLQVISWALLLSLPILLPVTLWLGWQYGVRASGEAWLGFAYVSLFSMFAGFYFWYRGLALGGIARVGQVQLVQPFLTLLGAALLLGEPLDVTMLMFAVAVVLVVAFGRRAAVRQAAGQATAAVAKNPIDPGD